jgi:hypothetical protein
MLGDAVAHALGTLHRRLQDGAEAPMRCATSWATSGSLGPSSFAAFISPRIP